MRKRVAVIGGGIAGLAAAVRLRDLTPPGTDIIVYEQGGVLGGKLRTGELAGLPVERGAESFLTAGPGGDESAVVALARHLGLGDALVHPATVPAALSVAGRLTPLPGGTLVGVPGDLTKLGDVAHVTGTDPDDGRPLLAAGEDVAVGELVRARYGAEVVDRLVDPMLGGVYAGRADRLSLDVTMPQLAATARVEHTLQGAVRAAQAARTGTPGPIFTAVHGGMSRLVAAAAAASGARISLGLPVRDLSRTAHGWRLLLGPAPAPQTDDVDAVIVAVPAKPASRLLTALSAEAAEAIGALDYASVALAGLALPPGTPLPELSGFLVPPSEGTLVKAATFFTRKWPHLGPEAGPVIVRASLGRYGEQDRLQFADEDLLEQARRELGELIGGALPPPAAAWIQRWGGSLPQYAPGHRDRVAFARQQLPPGLALAGAAFDGVGIPACVASGERAAEDVSKSLEE
ncbi:protoporphyrinogen oxidase [Paractinoplanes durhamensis]|uniref:Coproporphyrinogen III oxidase n=1 Tax=Paractinoplanes durhamensis TaxID=113563 RepID=A0ABQ3YM95_9ACTN|nr:protoporphyrinogen oxidase [Actinoplanes durhamensis]GID98695.1 protoporphyrinogen oxidase [Actinoplanes durhamensis]